LPRGEKRSICAGIFDYYADHGEHLLAPQTLPSPRGDGTLLSQPLGIIFGIQPWNYPCYQVVRFAAPNLMGWKRRAVEACF
jgi:succinate-semialdehyde dehydrogenase/glutarate-semialdehyde dehydrogenase